VSHGILLGYRFEPDGIAKKTTLGASNYSDTAGKLL